MLILLHNSFFGIKGLRSTWTGALKFILLAIIIPERKLTLFWILAEWEITHFPFFIFYNRKGKENISQYPLWYFLHYTFFPHWWKKNHIFYDKADTWVERARNIRGNVEGDWCPQTSFRYLVLYLVLITPAILQSKKYYGLLKEYVVSEEEIFPSLCLHSPPENRWMACTVQGKECTQAETVNNACLHL